MLLHSHCDDVGNKQMTTYPNPNSKPNINFNIGRHLESYSLRTYTLATTSAPRWGQSSHDMQRKIHQCRKNLLIGDQPSCTFTTPLFFLANHPHFNLQFGILFSMFLSTNYCKHSQATTTAARVLPEEIT